MAVQIWSHYDKVASCKDDLLPLKLDLEAATTIQHGIDLRLQAVSIRSQNGL